MKPELARNDIVWRPTPEVIAASHLQRFMSAHGIATLADLQRRSVDEPRWFWRAVLDDLGIEFFQSYSEVMDTSAGLPWTRFAG